MGLMINLENPTYISARHQRKGRRKPVQLIVIHSMEAPEGRHTAEAIARYFQRGPVIASAHYCVDAISFVQCVWDGDTAYHCKNANSNGIGIEHAGYARQTCEQWLDGYGIDMLNISAQIAAYLCNKFNIPVARAEFKATDDPTVVKRGFCGHVDVPNHGHHWDPGQGFPWDWYLGRVAHYEGYISGTSYPTLGDETTNEEPITWLENP